MAEIEKHELSESDFLLFQKEFNKWVIIFGLKGWSIRFEFADLDNKYGKISANLNGRIAIITLNKNLDKDLYSIDQVKKTAFHECCELFLTRINALAHYRHTAADEIEEEIHNIIRTMEYLRENLNPIKLKTCPYKEPICKE